MLKDKCALATGSTAGQGRQIAAALAALGANILLNGLGDPDEIEQLRSALSREHGVAVLYHGANLAEPSQVDAMVRTAGETFSGLDILVNNAVVRHFASMETYPLDEWQLALAVNLTAPFLPPGESCLGCDKRAGDASSIWHRTKAFSARPDVSAMSRQ